MRTACAGAVVLLLVAAASAAPKDAAQVETQVKRVALFKNGLGFFTRGGSLPEKAGPIELAPFAAPSHGTMWISYPTTVGLGPLIAREAAIKEKKEATNLAELLRANVGRQATIWLGTEKERSVTGKILSFVPYRKPPAADPYAMGGMPIGAQPQYERYYVPPQPGGTLVLVGTDTGVVAINAYGVQRIDFAEGDPATTFGEEAKGVELSAELKKPARDAWVRVSYLAKGITWAPSYLVDITDAKEARIAAKAVIINEAEELKGAQVELVTGFPNLQFADVMDPMGLKEDLGRFLQTLARGRPETEERYRASVMTQSMDYRGYAGAGPEREAAMPQYGAAAAGRVAEDLFLYPLESVTLAKGERGYYPLFTETVPYEEIYQWQIPDYITPEEQYGQQRERAAQPEVVWHSLKLTNTTKVPWTTAPAETTKEGQVLGQDTLNYTPPKGEATLRITQAVSVKAEQTELEVKRERDAVQMYGSSYDRITIEGKLRVRNFLEKTISLEIKKTLSGEVKKMTPEAKAERLARGLARMNPVHSLTWDIRLKPGGEQELAYVYEALIRR